jgi:acetyl esterase/lipase
VGPQPDRQRLAYGPDPNQFGDLYRPATPAAEAPVAVLLHGGFWRARYGLDLMEPLAADLVARGFVVWNLEYRRVGQPGGGVPGTLDDVAAGVDALAPGAPGIDRPRVDLDRVVIIGHSAGGHLALWLAGQPDRRVEPALTVGLAAVTDLVRGAEEGLGDDGLAVANFTGGQPNDQPEHYRAAQPEPSPDARARHPVVLVHGAEDTVVPVAYSVDAAPAWGAELVVVPDADHFAVIDPASSAWSATVEVITGHLAQTGANGQRHGPGRSAS